MGCMCKGRTGRNASISGYSGPITENNGVLKGVITFFHENKSQIESSSSESIKLPEHFLAPVAPSTSTTYVFQPVVINSVVASQLWVSLAAVVIIAFVIGFIVAIIFAKSCVTV